MKLAQSPLVALSLLTLAACGGGGGSKSGGSAVSPETSPVVIRQILTPDSAFEKWKNAPLKACDLETAFGVKTGAKYPDTQVGLDLGLILSNNKDSALFQSGKDVFILSDFTELSGFSSGYSYGTGLNADVKRQGSLCVVKVDGKVVYRTTIVESATIGMQTTIGQVEQESSFKNAVRNTFIPKESAVTSFGKMLKLSSVEASQVLRGGAVGPSVFYRESGSTSWKALGLAPSNEFSGADVRFTNLNLISSGKVLNPADNGSFTFRYQYDPNQPGIVTVKSFEGFKAYNIEEALNCVRSNVALNLTNAVNICEAMSPDLQERLLSRDVLQELVLLRFSQFQAREGENDGWKDVLKGLVKKTLEVGKTVESLDPDHKTALLPRVALFMNAAAGMPVGLQSEILDLAVERAFSTGGETPGHFQELVSELAFLSTPFVESVRLIIGDLARPSYYSKALEFSRSIPDMTLYKERALKVREIAKRKRNRVFESRYFNMIFQQSITLEMLNTWIKSPNF